ncbi:hypothetical protein Gohar_014688 [Gossypium harknessii]|uniref:Uncharacterized protein n=1 Tax=Gossypium harknessii TaxID=34285 RepID=A0A7J9FYL1_9ROSI|nr:hypothetical protein [Gossypium harknessii]
MARGIPNYDDGGSFYDHTGGGGASGGQYFTQSSSLSTSSSSDSLYHSSINRGTIGDVFFGTDDIRDTRDLLYKEDVLESYQKETAQKYLRQRSKKRSISNFGYITDIIVDYRRWRRMLRAVRIEVCGELHPELLRCKVWDEVWNGVVGVLGDGRSVDFWRDVWIHGSESLAAYCLQSILIPAFHVLVRDMVTKHGQCAWNQFSFLLPTQCLVKIAPIRPPCGEEIMDWPDLGIYKCPKKVDVTFMVSAIDGEKESKCRRWPELGIIHNRNGRRRDPRCI